MAIKTQQFKVDGMQCTGCEDIICEAVSSLPGIAEVNANYSKGSVIQYFKIHYLSKQ